MQFQYNFANTTPLSQESLQVKEILSKNLKKTIMFFLYKKKKGTFSAKAVRVFLSFINIIPDFGSRRILMLWWEVAWENKAQERLKCSFINTRRVTV